LSVAAQGELPNCRNAPMSTAFAAPVVETVSPSSKSPRVLVSVATYNELENLPLLVDEMFAVAPQVEILVIDDNSPDGTGVWAKERSQSDPRVHVMHRAGKLGLGTATIAAMKYAIEHDYDYLLNLDADFSHHPRYIPALIAGMDQADVMIGSRYCPGGGVKDWPLKRRLMSQGVNLYARTALGLKPGDCSGAYRCFRVDTLRKIDFSKIRSRGYSFQEEILWHLKRVGARFDETPIIFADRERGQSKINGKEALAALWIIFRLGVKNWIGL
jgi:dolichol-phosphate mannosyltransferase